MSALVEKSLIGRKLAPFNPTNHDAIEIALNLLKLSDKDTLYDLGCGDGRVVIKANLVYGTPGIGVEYDHDLCAKAKNNAVVSGCGENVKIIHDSVENVDFSDATAIFVYLVPEGMKAIQDKLKAAVLDRGVRVVTHVFSIPGLVPVETVLYKNIIKIYLYQRPEVSTPGTNSNELGVPLAPPELSPPR